MEFLLSTLVFIPLLLSALIWLVPERLVREASLVFSIAHFGLSLRLLSGFQPEGSALQFVEKSMWIKQFGISYFLAIDGLSIWLVLLTCFLTPIVVLASWTAIEEKRKAFHSALFALTGTMIGSFVALDMILFYIFFEASLIPMYFMIGIWGGARRLYATVKFFLYTMAGSLLMLIAILSLMVMAREQLGFLTAALPDLLKLKIPFVGASLFSTQALVMMAFALAFAIKVPMFPFHTWLPDAHVEAPTPGSVLLAAVMLKVGTYGLMRFVIPLFPDAVDYWSWLFVFLAVVGIIYGALVAMAQTDIKKLVAYSSVSHMGYVILGLFSFNSFGMEGALYQMLNHGISTGALFLLVGMMYERTHSRDISDYGGVAARAPWFSVAFIIVTMSSIAVPMTNGFIGEFLILIGAFGADPVMGVFATSGVVLGAAYMLWLVKRVFFGEVSELVEQNQKGLEINFREGIVLAPLVVLIFWMGVQPNSVLSYSRNSVKHLVDNKSSYHLVIHGDVDFDSKQEGGQ